MALCSSELRTRPARIEGPYCENRGEAISTEKPVESPAPVVTCRPPRSNPRCPQTGPARALVSRFRGSSSVALHLTCL